MQRRPQREVRSNANDRHHDAAFCCTKPFRWCCLVSLMQQGRTVALDPALAMAAARLSFELKLPMADSIILATARQFNALLWTQDVDFENLPGVRYIAAARTR